MQEYTTRDISQATRLLGYLLAKKQLTPQSNKELFDLYMGSVEVQNIFRESFEPELQIKVFRSLNTIYLVPEMENDYLAYTNAELEALMSFKNVGQVKLNQFVWLVILSEFYGNNFIISGEPNQFVKKGQIVQKVSSYLSDFAEEYARRGDEFSTYFKMDFGHLIDTWNTLAETTDMNENKRTAKTQEGFIGKVLSLYEKEFQLIRIEDGEEILLTEKAQAIINACYHHDERIDKITELLNGQYNAESTEMENEF